MVRAPCGALRLHPSSVRSRGHLLPRGRRDSAVDLDKMIGMKFGELRSIGHNIADSLASGIGLPIGVYMYNVFEEAQRTASGAITVDFLRGVPLNAGASDDLKRVAWLYRGALRELCGRHGVEPTAFRRLTARFGVDAVHGRHFTVTVEDQTGRQSEDLYLGAPGRPLRTRKSAPAA